MVLTLLAVLSLVLSSITTILSTPVLALPDTSSVGSSGSRGDSGGSTTTSVTAGIVVTTTVTVLASVVTSAAGSDSVSTSGSSRGHGTVTTQNDSRCQNGRRLADEAGVENGADGGGVLLCLGRACLLVGFDGDGQGRDVDHALVLDLGDGLEGGDGVGRVGGGLRVDLLHGEAAAEGAGDGVVAAADGADVAC